MHKLSDKDLEARTAVCLECGPTTIKHRPHKGEWVCRNAWRELQRRSRLGPGAKPPIQGACDICRVFTTLYWDHSHESGRHRGYLCRSCNLMLGYAKDRVDTLRAAITYLSD